MSIYPKNLALVGKGQQIHLISSDFSIQSFKLGCWDPEWRAVLIWYFRVVEWLRFSQTKFHRIEDHSKNATLLKTEEHLELLQSMTDFFWLMNLLLFLDLKHWICKCSNDWYRSELILWHNVRSRLMSLIHIIYLVGSAFTNLIWN